MRVLNGMAAYAHTYVESSWTHCHTIYSIYIAIYSYIYIYIYIYIAILYSYIIMVCLIPI